MDKPVPAGGEPVRVPILLNRTITFKQPGRYTVTVTTERLIPPGQGELRTRGCADNESDRDRGGVAERGGRELDGEKALCGAGRGAEGDRTATSGELYVIEIEESGGGGSLLRTVL
jgi:hypothetical protein